MTDKAPEGEYWFNTSTGEVEKGPQSVGSHRMGPYRTAEEASRAYEIAAERTRKWDEEHED